jgi:hypothetical protein
VATKQDDLEAAAKADGTAVKKKGSKHRSGKHRLPH